MGPFTSSIGEQVSHIRPMADRLEEVVALLNARGVEEELQDGAFAFKGSRPTPLSQCLAGCTWPRRRSTTLPQGPRGRRPTASANAPTGPCSRNSTKCPLCSLFGLHIGLEATELPCRRAKNVLAAIVIGRRIARETDWAGSGGHPGSSGSEDRSGCERFQRPGRSWGARARDRA